MPKTLQFRAFLPSVACLAVLLSACNQRDCGSCGDADEWSVGVLIDSPVGNIAYETASDSGRTNARGEFTYQVGETVTFSIGDVKLPAASAGIVMSPMTLAGTTDPTEASAANIARLLQTIDSDGNPDNGITIDDTAHSAATGLTGIDFSSTSFAADVDALVKNSGAPTTTLVTARAAIAHMQSQSRTVELAVQGPEGTVYDQGIQTFIVGTPYTEAEVSGKAFTLEPFDQGPWTLEFYADGTGLVTFGPGDTNPLSSWLVAGGTIHATDRGDAEDSWSIVLTPIEQTPGGENVLVEVSTPEGQADALNGAGLGTFTETGGP